MWGWEQDVELAPGPCVPPGCKTPAALHREPLTSCSLEAGLSLEQLLQSLPEAPQQQGAEGEAPS